MSKLSKLLVIGSGVAVANFYTKNPKKVDDLVSDALRKIILHEIDCLPVVREEAGGRVIVGKISKTTLIKLLLEILEG